MKIISIGITLIIALVFAGCTGKQHKVEKRHMSMEVLIDMDNLDGLTTSTARLNDSQKRRYVIELLQSDTILKKTLDRIHRTPGDADGKTIKSRLQLEYTHGYKGIIIKLFDYDDEFSSEFLMQLVGMVNVDLYAVRNTRMLNEISNLETELGKRKEWLEKEFQEIIDFDEIKADAVNVEKMKSLKMLSSQLYEIKLLQIQLAQSKVETMEAEDIFIFHLKDEKLIEMLLEYTETGHVLDSLNCRSQNREGCEDLETQYNAQREYINDLLAELEAVISKERRNVGNSLIPLFKKLEKERQFKYNRDFEKKVESYFEFIQEYHQMKQDRKLVFLPLMILEQPRPVGK